MYTKQRFIALNYLIVLLLDASTATKHVAAAAFDGGFRCNIIWIN
jgi:hypothetical protein